MSPGTRLSPLQQGSDEDLIARGSVRLLRDAGPADDAGDVLLWQVLETVTSFVSAGIALGFEIGERLTVERIIVRGEHAGDADAAAPLIRRLPDLEPIDPLNPRRAEATGASVMGAADAGGSEQAAASMYGRHLRRHGYGVPVAMYFRNGGRIVSGLMLLRTIEAPAFEGHDVELLLRLQPFLELALTFTGSPGEASSEALSTAALTSREAEVARLVADGLSNACVAAALGMSEATVKAHLTRVYAKLGVRSRTQLAVLLPRPTDAVSPPVEVGAA